MFTYDLKQTSVLLSLYCSISKSSLASFCRSLRSAGHVCDCSTVWFLRSLKEERYRKRLYNPSDIGYCFYPLHLKSRKIQSVTVHEVCPQFDSEGTTDLTGHKVVFQLRCELQNHEYCMRYRKGASFLPRVAQYDFFCRR